MGREARTDYIAGRERVAVKAHLDTAAVQLSGGKKLTVPFASIKSAVAAGEDLKIVAGGARFALRLGAKEAALWAKKILNPPSLADKLGVKPGTSVLLIGDRVAEIDEAAAAGAAVARAATLAAAKAKIAAAGLAILTLTPASAAKDVAAAAKLLPETAALWLVYLKGAKPNGDEIIALARKAGLKDTKVARVSETHAALRFIRPKG